MPYRTSAVAPNAKRDRGIEVSTHLAVAGGFRGLPIRDRGIEVSTTSR